MIKSTVTPMDAKYGPSKDIAFASFGRSRGGDRRQDIGIVNQ